MLSVCKDHLEQREREIKVTRSELEESGAILVDRLVITTELQRTNELLSVQLKQALLEKEVIGSEDLISILGPRPHSKSVEYDDFINASWRPTSDDAYAPKDEGGEDAPSGEAVVSAPA